MKILISWFSHSNRSKSIVPTTWFYFRRYFGRAIVHFWKFSLSQWSTIITSLLFREHVELTNGQQMRKKLFYALISSRQFQSTLQEIVILGMVKPLKVISNNLSCLRRMRQIIFKRFPVQSISTIRFALEHTKVIRSRLEMVMRNRFQNMDDIKMP